MGKLAEFARGEMKNTGNPRVAAGDDQVEGFSVAGPPCEHTDQEAKQHHRRGAGGMNGVFPVMG